MDYATIIVAGISLIGTLVGSYLSNSKTSALIAYRIEQLESKVNKHNNLVERTYKIESDQATQWRRHDELKEEVHTLKDDIHRLEEKI